MSNIEEDIKTMHKIISFYKDLDIINDNGKCKEIKAIEHILAEREQDKKIIKELEEQVKILDEAYTGVIKESKKWFDIAHSRISKQKVKYVIKNETINISGFECIAVENLEELLEDK